MLGPVIDEAAARFGDASALVAPDGSTWSFATLARLSDEVAAGLRALGLGEGDVVALRLGSSAGHVAAYLGAAKAGVITAAINARLTAAEQTELLTVARPALVVEREDDAPVPLPAGAQRITVPATGRDDELLAPLRSPGASAPGLIADPERPVAIVFTSGTTGTPRGAVFAGRQLTAITEIDTGFRWASAPGAPQLAGTSLAHLGPMTKLAGTFVRGSCQHLLERWRAAEALELVERLRVPGIGGIPTQLALMLREPGFAARDLRCVQAVVVGGGPATPALIRAIRTGFGARVAVRYSCTEAGIGVGTDLEAPDEDAEVSVGRPHPGVELTIRDGDTVLADGEVGEVCLRSAATMSGYWDDDEATAAAFTPDGAVRTGDLGWIDPEGRLRLAGRRSERYVRGGYNVHPLEVEAVLIEHPAVAAVAVVGRSDDVMGEVGVAVVVPAPGVPTPDLGALRSFAAARLAHHKLPEDLVIVDALPLTPMDKVDRRALRALVSA